MSAKEEENVKLFKQGGADAIVSPATFGGYILAATVDQGHMMHYLDDLLTARSTIALVERTVRRDEIGNTPADLKPEVLLRLYRGSQMLSIFEFGEADRLRDGDIMVLLTNSKMLIKETRIHKTGIRPRHTDRWTNPDSVFRDTQFFA